jgi:hypothetical protein
MLFVDLQERKRQVEVVGNEGDYLCQELDKHARQEAAQSSLLRCTGLLFVAVVFLVLYFTNCLLNLVHQVTDSDFVALPQSKSCQIAALYVDKSQDVDIIYRDESFDR